MVAVTSVHVKKMGITVSSSGLGGVHKVGESRIRGCGIFVRTQCLLALESAQHLKRAAMHVRACSNLFNLVQDSPQPRGGPFGSARPVNDRPGKKHINNRSSDAEVVLARSCNFGSLLIS